MARQISRALSWGRLDQGLADGGGDAGLLGSWHAGQQVPHRMDPASLPRGAQDLADGLLQPFVGVRDHQLHALEAALVQRAEEVDPERCGFRQADVQPDDLPAALGVGRHSDYHRHRDDPATLALLQIGGVQPHVRPVALQRPLQEGADPLVDVLAQLGDLRLGDAAHAHGLHQVLHPTGGDAGDPGLLDDGGQRLLDGAPGLQERREVRGAGPELGDL